MAAEDRRWDYASVRRMHEKLKIKGMVSDSVSHPLPCLPEEEKGLRCSDLRHNCGGSFFDKLMVSFFGVYSCLILVVLALLLVILPLVLPPLPPPPLALLLVPIGIMVLLFFIAFVPSNIVVSSV